LCFSGLSGKSEVGKKKFILNLRATLMTEANIINGALIKYLQENFKIERTMYRSAIF